ncbi:MAG: BON domain-containing protein [Betaproteobacteria bacterium]|nr:MAG: BON domain-containing protein [Betaproteobacteria bacterium]
MILGTTPRPPSPFSIFIAAAIFACALGLSGCIPLAITGVAATASVATDRRSTGAQLDDELIEDKTAVQVLERFKGNDVHVNVTSYNGNVLLTGEVPFESVKTEIGEIAGRMAKARSVQNDLLVGAATGLGSRSNDTLITSKVKARFVESNQFQINHVKVVTERGIVYLLGIVRPAEGNAAAEIARTTSGVQRVVKVFEYIN